MFQLNLLSLEFEFKIFIEILSEKRKINNITELQFSHIIDINQYYNLILNWVYIIIFYKNFK